MRHLQNFQFVATIYVDRSVSQSGNVMSCVSLYLQVVIFVIMGANEYTSHVMERYYILTNLKNNSISRKIK